jgi:hypothetical protein
MGTSNDLSDLPKEKQSEYILNNNIGSELELLWGFNPYFVRTSITALNRESSPFIVECKNCGNQIIGTFTNLEKMRMRGYYCPVCHGSYNPVYKSLLPKDFAETNEEYKILLGNEYSVMTAIKEKYGHQPYRFKSIDTGKKLTLEHVACASIFSTTLTMIFENSNYVDKYTGGNLELPYCPKCNHLFTHEGINYGGLRFVENLHNVYAASGKPFPYEFNEEDIYRFKGYRHEMLCICIHCNKAFAVVPEYLFEIGSTSKCPFCGGKSLSKDSGKRRIEEVQLNSIEDVTSQTQITEEVPDDNAISSMSEISSVEYEDLKAQGYVQSDNVAPLLTSNEPLGEDVSLDEDATHDNMLNEEENSASLCESDENISDMVGEADEAVLDIADLSSEDLAEELDVARRPLEEHPLSKSNNVPPLPLEQDPMEQPRIEKFNTLMGQALEEGFLSRDEEVINGIIVKTAEDLNLDVQPKHPDSKVKYPSPKIGPVVNPAPKKEVIDEEVLAKKEEAPLTPIVEPITHLIADTNTVSSDAVPLPVVECAKPKTVMKTPSVANLVMSKQLKTDYAQRQRQPTSTPPDKPIKKTYVDGDMIHVTFVIKRPTRHASNVKQMET